MTQQLKYHGLKNRNDKDILSFQFICINNNIMIDNKEQIKLHPWYETAVLAHFNNNETAKHTTQGPLIFKLIYSIVFCSLFMQMTTCQQAFTEIVYKTFKAEITKLQVK